MAMIPRNPWNSATGLAIIRRARASILPVVAIWLALAVPGQGLAQSGTPGMESLGVDPTQLSPVVTHPLVPLASLGYRLLEGDITDSDTGETIHERVEEWVLPEPATVAGVEVTVVDVYEYEDGELTEHTLDYYAQHRDGTVYYLGEDVDMYEDGEIVGHEGAWRAGEGENVAGVFMPADPAVGREFVQEGAPGVAEERSTVTAVDQAITVPAGSFTGCIHIEEVHPLEDETEFKVVCPNVGVVLEESEEGALALITVEPAQAATPVG